MWHPDLEVRVEHLGMIQGYLERGSSRRDAAHPSAARLMVGRRRALAERATRMAGRRFAQMGLSLIETPVDRSVAQRPHAPV